jgi:hypothetical protein
MKEQLYQRDEKKGKERRSTPATKENKRIGGKEGDGQVEVAG